MYRLAQRYGLLIVEDDPYCYIRYPGGPGECLSAALLLRPCNTRAVGFRIALSWQLGMHAAAALDRL